MRPKPKHVVLLLSFIATVGIVSCRTNSTSPNLSASTNDIGDGGLLSGIPCGSPCFLDITPGITTEDQARELLQSKGVNKNCKNFDKVDQGGTRGFVCESFIIILRNDSDIVTSIGFQPTVPITVRDLIEKIGEPSAILVTAVGLTDRYPITMSAVLYFDTIHTNVVLEEQVTGEFNVQPTTPIVNIGYSDKESYELNSRYSVNWSGYGVYSQANP